MGDRGRVVHVRVSSGDALLAVADLACALLAANKNWLSLVPLRGVAFEIAALAAAARADVAQVWFDDDAGATLQIAGADGFAGELSVNLADDGGPGAEDRRFVDRLVRRRLLTTPAAQELKARLADRPKKRDAWVLRHGLEASFGSPGTRLSAARSSMTWEPTRKPHAAGGG